MTCAAQTSQNPYSIGLVLALRATLGHYRALYFCHSVDRGLSPWHFIAPRQAIISISIIAISIVLPFDRLLIYPVVLYVDSVSDDCLFINLEPT